MKNNEIRKIFSLDWEFYLKISFQEIKVIPDESMNFDLFSFDIIHKEVENNFLDGNYFVSRKILQKLEKLCFDNKSELKNIINKKNPFFKSILSWVKNELNAYKKYYHDTGRNLFTYIENTACPNGSIFDYQVVQIVDTLAFFTNHRIYYTATYDIWNERKIVIDFYEIDEKQRWKIYYVEPIFIDEKGNTYKMFEFFPWSILNRLWFMSFMNYGGWYKYLVKVIHEYMAGEHIECGKNRKRFIERSQKIINDFYDNYIKGQE